MIFPSTVQGIPCQVEILSVRASDPGRIHGPIELCYPPEEGEIEFQLRDRKGYLAPWLEKIVTLADQERIEGEILARHNGKIYDYD